MDDAFFEYIEEFVILTNDTVQELKFEPLAMLESDSYDGIEQFEQISTIEHQGYEFVKALQSQLHFVITDGTKSDNPIMFANSSFLSAHFSSKQIIGSSCSSLNVIFDDSCH